MNDVLWWNALLSHTNDPELLLLVAMAAVDPPWRLDPMQNIINISWGAGLAVIFAEYAEDSPVPPVPIR